MQVEHYEKFVQVRQSYDEQFWHCGFIPSSNVEEGQEQN
jgi:hypothetical protein